MEFLRKEWSASLALMSFLTAGCGDSVTKVIPLETDTYISTGAQDNRAELEFLQISRSGPSEDRIITKLPTTDKDTDDVLDDVLEDSFAILFFMPFYILANLASCDSELFVPANITAAELKFDVAEDLEGSLSGKMTLATLTRPWWQSVTWTKAHPFSSEGIWSTPGGDLDPSFTPIPNSAGTSGSTTTVSFDILNYYKELALANGSRSHYGFVIRPVADMNRVRLASTQSSYYSRPRAVVTYTGVCRKSASSGWLLRDRATRTTTYLGRDPIVVTEEIPAE